ncbi:MAG: hypothetical protein K8R59_15400 [Thermoanaerobaculales bacterium]|nr:hypothetical protein [Thermoanaerobaculales bacterium]
MNEKAPSSPWAQGSLASFSPLELLERLAELKFTGRLSLVNAEPPHRVVTLHLEEGEPVLTVGSGIPRDLPPDEDGYRSRQVLLEALCWNSGRFDIVEGPPGSVVDSHREALGDIRGIIRAAEDRLQVWERYTFQLPDTWDRVIVKNGNPSEPPTNVVEAAILSAAETGSFSLAEIAHRAFIDEHILLRAAVDLSRNKYLRLTLSEEDGSNLKTELEQAVVQVLSALDTAESHTLKITILSWDSATSFRAVDTLLGRARTPPENIEQMPKYQVISEELELGHQYEIEVLAFRSDMFDPDFCAPLIQDSHLFLLFTDLDSGHSEMDERPLVERINTLRGMYCEASVAGRITIGGSAVTDPGCDVLLPELGRYFNWNEIQKNDFLPSLLNEVAKRLG